MAKLYFRYGAMGSSKSANILMVRYNYEERGQYAVLLKPRTDNRDGEHEIKSRIGLEAPAEYVDEFLEEISKTWSADSPSVSGIHAADGDRRRHRGSSDGLLVRKTCTVQYEICKRKNRAGRCADFPWIE